MKRISFLVALSCLLVGMTASAVSKKSMAFMFVIDAAQGKLSHIKGKQFQLSIPVKDIKSVLAFSDRPHRQNFRLSQTDYAKLVYSGKNSFRDNPPNIALVWAAKKTRPEVYMLAGYRQVKNNIIYSLIWQAPSSPVATIKNKQGKVALFIDPLEINELGICMRVQDRIREENQSSQQLRQQLRDEVSQEINRQSAVCSFRR